MLWDWDHYKAARWLALLLCGSRGCTIMQFSLSRLCISIYSYGNGGAEQIIGRFTAAEKPGKVHTS